MPDATRPPEIAVLGGTGTPGPLVVTEWLAKR